MLIENLDICYKPIIEMESSLYMMQEPAGACKTHRVRWRVASYLCILYPIFTNYRIPEVKYWLLYICRRVGALHTMSQDSHF